MQTEEESNKEICKYFNKVVTTIDNIYESWVDGNIKCAPLLKEPDNSLNKSYQWSARYGIAAMAFTVLEIWSYAGDILGGDANEDKSNDNFMFLLNQDFITSEIARHCYSSTRILTYQAIANKRAAGYCDDALDPDDLMQAFLNLYMMDGCLKDSFFNNCLLSDLNLDELPIESLYVPKAIRRDVFKRLLASLFNKLEYIGQADDVFKLVSDIHDSIADEVSEYAFHHMSSSRPCHPGGCLMHRFYFEHLD